MKKNSFNNQKPDLCTRIIFTAAGRKTRNIKSHVYRTASSLNSHKETAFFPTIYENIFHIFSLLQAERQRLTQKS